MNQPKKEGSQFESGFGGSVFGGATGMNTQAGNQQNSPGEFGSASFAGTNAVSQIFKDAGADDKKKKMINIAIISGCLLAICGAGYFFFFWETAPTDTVVTPPAAATTAATEEVDTAAEDDEIADEEATTTAAPAAESPVAGNSATWAYNEATGGPVVTVAPGTVVEVSRNQAFSGPYVTGKANAAGKFRIPAPPAGNIYWRSAGNPAVNAIAISAPQKLGLSFRAPASLQTGGTVSWTSSNPGTFYRVEVATDAQFSSPTNTFSTKAQTVALKDVGAGKYFVRVGGFNSAAGKWEWSRGGSVEIK
jgi:hypothetical protein